MSLKFLKKQTPILFMFILGTLSCFYLHFEFDFSPVLTSAFLGLIGSFIPLDNKLILSSAFYSGSFAGMCTFDRIENHQEIIFIAIFGAFIFIALKNKFNGLGGKLGTIAFIASISLVIFKEFLI